MRVSVITVVYNAANTIEKTIRSVLVQNYVDIEYIIIDGGSTDGTVDIIKKYENKLAYWVSEPDGGIYDAMNKGIGHASGDIIGIINSDDWYSKDTLKSVMEVFTKKENVELIHGDIYYTTEEGNPYARFSPVFHGEDIWHDMIVYHPTCFVRRALYEKYGAFSTDYRVAGDYDFFLRLHRNKIKFQYLPEDLVYFRLGGMSDKNAYLGMKEVRDIAIKYGYNPINANLWYAYKSLKYWMFHLLNDGRWKFIIDLYHRVRSNLVICQPHKRKDFKRITRK